MIAKGGNEGERYRLQHQANNCFRKASSMLSAADDARGCLVETTLQPFTALVEPVSVTSAVYEDWKAEHERRGWPWLPEHGKQRVVYFPKGGPAGMVTFEDAMKDVVAPRV